MNLQEIYEEFGEEIGKIHSLKAFDFFGNWDENGQSIDNEIDFSKIFKSNTKNTLKELFSQHLEEEELQRRGAELLESMLYLVDNVDKSHLCNGDFGERNIIVKMIDGKWHITALIDFEQATPGDRDSDLIDCYYRLQEENEKFAECFKKGYEKYLKFSDNLDKKKALYELSGGLGICSWAKIQAPDYYPEGIRIIKKYV